jgi:hypothetical protein
VSTCKTKQSYLFLPCKVQLRSRSYNCGLLQGIETERVFPQCIAFYGVLLHIIDFSLCTVIVRSAFGAFTPRGFSEKTNRKIVKWRICRHELLFVHCVSKQPSILSTEGLPCVQLECREVHVSFTDSLTIRRIALCPAVVNGIKIDEMFADCGSPTPVQIHSKVVFLR